LREIHGHHGEALNVAYHPLRMRAEENDRKGVRRMMRRKVSMPSMRGISLIEVTPSASALQFFSMQMPVHRRADNFDGRVAREDRGISFPHESGIIDDETRMRSLMHRS